MKFGEFLKKKRLEKGYTLRQMAYKTGFSHTYISDIEKEVAAKLETINKIADILELSREEKIFLQKEIEYFKTPENVLKELKELKNSKEVKHESNVKRIEKDLVVIELPVYGSASAGGGVINLTNIVRYEKILMLPGEELPKDSFVVEVSGDSMVPTLMDGDLAIVDPYCEDINLKNEICVVTYDGCEYIKRISYNEKYVTLMSDNSDMNSYPPIMVLKDENTDFKCHGIVIESRRKFRRR